jgi:hypothetical protein
MSAIANAIALIIVAVILISFSLLWVIDLLDKASTLREYAPWLVTFAEHRKRHAIVLLACWILLCFNGVEYYFKEIPEVPKMNDLKFITPPPPAFTIVEFAPPVRPQCWVKNYATPALPDPHSWGIATIVCNTTIKPPYSVEVNYDQTVVVGPFTFPAGSEFSKATEFNEGTKVVSMFDLHTIIPNEPFSIMAKGSSDKFPEVKTAAIRAKGFVLEFHP